MHLAQLTLPRYDNVPILNRFQLKFIPDHNNYDTALGYSISRITLLIVASSGTIFFLKLIAGGYGYLTSAGDSTKIQNATKDLINAVIGLLITVAAYFLLQIIQFIFGINII